MVDPMANPDLFDSARARGDLKERMIHVEANVQKLDEKVDDFIEKFQRFASHMTGAPINGSPIGIPDGGAMGRLEDVLRDHKRRIGDVEKHTVTRTDLIVVFTIGAAFLSLLTGLQIYLEHAMLKGMLK